MAVSTRRTLHTNPGIWPRKTQPCVLLWFAGTFQSMAACLPATGSSRGCLPTTAAFASLGRAAGTTRLQATAGLDTTPAAVRPPLWSDCQRSRVSAWREQGGRWDSLNRHVCLPPFGPNHCPACGTDPGRPLPPGHWTVIPPIKIGEGFTAKHSERDPADDTWMVLSSFHPGSLNWSAAQRT